MPTEAVEMKCGVDARTHAFPHDFGHHNGRPVEPAWRAAAGGRPGSRFERLMFLGGHADPRTAEGSTTRDDPGAQVDGAFRELEVTLATLEGRPQDIVKLVVFHTGQSEEEETALLRAIRRRIVAEPPPAISLGSLPRLADPGAALLIKGIAVDNADAKAPRRAVQHLDDIAAQAQLTIDNIVMVLRDLGCDLDDVVKLNTWYVGFGTDEDWRKAAEVRSRAFRFPGPCATGVPVPGRYPDSAFIRQECLALRVNDGTRLPRALSWPFGH